MCERDDSVVCESQTECDRLDKCGYQCIICINTFSLSSVQLVNGSLTILQLHLV